MKNCKINLKKKKKKDITFSVRHGPHNSGPSLLLELERPPKHKKRNQFYSSLPTSRRTTPSWLAACKYPQPPHGPSHMVPRLTVLVVLIFQTEVSSLHRRTPLLVGQLNLYSLPRKKQNIYINFYINL